MLGSYQLRTSRLPLAAAQAFLGTGRAMAASVQHVSLAIAQAFSWNRTCWQQLFTNKFLQQQHWLLWTNTSFVSRMCRTKLL